MCVCVCACKGFPAVGCHAGTTHVNKQNHRTSTETKEVLCQSHDTLVVTHPGVSILACWSPSSYTLLSLSLSLSHHHHLPIHHLSIRAHHVDASEEFLFIRGVSERQSWASEPTPPNYSSDNEPDNEPLFQIARSDCDRKAAPLRPHTTGRWRQTHTLTVSRDLSPNHSRRHEVSQVRNSLTL